MKPQGWNSKLLYSIRNRWKSQILKKRSPAAIHKSSESLIEQLTQIDHYIESYADELKKIYNEILNSFPMRTLPQRLIDLRLIKDYRFSYELIDNLKNIIPPHIVGRLRQELDEYWDWKENKEFFLLRILTGLHLKKEVYKFELSKFPWSFLDIVSKGGRPSALLMDNTVKDLFLASREDQNNRSIRIADFINTLAGTDIMNAKRISNKIYYLKHLGELSAQEEEIF